MLDRLPSEHDTTTIVLVGSFNPRIFQPAWFVAQGLLPPEEGSTANVRFINNDICAFDTDWCRVEVLAERASFTTLAAPVVEALRDLVMGAFAILRHAPVTKLGLNSSAHYALPSEDAWHRFGHLAAPKDDLWSPILTDPGMLSLAIQGRRPDAYDGHVQIRLTPSVKICNGLYVDINDEYRKLDATTSNWAVEVVCNEWDNYRNRVQGIRRHLLGIALEER